MWHATVASLLGLDGIPGVLTRFLEHEAGRETALQPETFECVIGQGHGSSGGESDYVTLEPDEGEAIRIRGGSTG